MRMLVFVAGLTARRPIALPVPMCRHLASYFLFEDSVLYPVWSISSWDCRALPPSSSAFETRSTWKSRWISCQATGTPLTCQSLAVMWSSLSLVYEWMVTCPMRTGLYRGFTRNTVSTPLCGVISVERTEIIKPSRSRPWWHAEAMRNSKSCSDVLQSFSAVGGRWWTACVSSTPVGPYTSPWKRLLLSMRMSSLWVSGRAMGNCNGCQRILMATGVLTALGTMTTPSFHKWSKEKNSVA